MLDHEKENPKNHHLTSLVKAVVSSLVKPMVTTVVKPLVKTMVTYLVKDMVIVVLPPPVPLRDCDHARANIQWRRLQGVRECEP